MVWGIVAALFDPARVAVPGAAADFECCGVRVLELGQYQLFEFEMTSGGLALRKFVMGTSD